MRLGDVIEIKHGYAFSGENIIEDDNNVVLVTPGNFKIGGGFQEKKCKFFDGEIPHDYVLKEGDFIVTMTDLSKTIDTLGYSALIPHSDKRMYLHNQRIGIVSFKNETCDRGYIYWLMRTHRYQREIANTSTGSTVHHTSPTKICAYEFEAPPLKVQHLIATILSRYDSLIENYQKQIKLLEEAAQRLYKEWFVDLHFPGHENTKIIDGLPEGWTPSLLGQLAEFKRGKTITKKDAIEGDIPVVAGGLEPAYYCNKSNTAERVITISGSGANAGFTRMYFEKVWASDCSFVDASVTPFLHFVYCYLKDNKTTIDNMQKGAAQPHVYAKDINSLELCIPIESVLTSFEGKASKYFDSISSLQSQIRLLAEARDRLLPKLMNGAIKVKSKQ
jgi:type I restriction enzyme S subunit